MKKIVIGLLAGAIALSMAACSAGVSQAEYDKVVSERDALQAELDALSGSGDAPEAEEKKAPAEKEQAKPKTETPVAVEDIPVSFEILPPDSVGTVYLQGTYTNNSDKTISSVDVSVLLKDSNEKTYLTFIDTTKPGETSPNSECFGPETGNKDDVEFLKYEIVVVQEDGSNLYINYDCKTGIYEIY